MKFISGANQNLKKRWVWYGPDQMKKIKIILILPAISLEERYNKALAHATGSLPPLGILSIATVLKKAGHSVAVLDGTIQPYNAIMEEINRCGPDIIGISAMTLMWPKVKLLSGELKKRWPGIDIIAGGVHASIIKEKALLEVPDLDAVCWGEGEFAMLEYAENFSKPSPRTAIDGIAFRGEDGSLIIGNDRDPINNLDLLPIPDRSLLPVTKYAGAIDQYQELPVTNMITTRGCPFKCIFCLPDLLGSGTRYRSADKVIEEIEYLIDEFGIRDIAFWDDIFTLNKERVFDLCQKIIEKRLGFIWSAQARADCVTPEMLELMARAGCWKLFYGVESLVQKNLDTLKKGETVKQIFDAVKWTKQAGIEAEGSFIFGIPGETFKDGLETIELANKLNLDYAKFYALCPYGRLRQEIEKYGALCTSDDENFTGGNVVTFVPFTMSKGELQKLLYVAYRKFYLKPKIIYRRLKTIGNPIEIKKTIKGLLTVIVFLIEEIKSGLKQWTKKVIG